MTLTTEAKKLLDAAAAANDEACRLLSKLVGFDTTNSRDTPETIAHCRAGIKACFAFLRAWAADNGFVFRNYEDLVCVIEAPGETKETVGVALHMDVVPAKGQWTRPPFSGDIADGFVWGRGTQDDKGPAAQTMMALKLLKELGVPFKRTIKLIVGSTEETAEWECVKRFLEVEPEPDFTMVPDAEFPIISGEKGFCTILADGAYDGAAPPQRPGGLKFLRLQAGHTENIVPDAAKLTLSGPESAGQELREIVDLYSRGRGRTAYVNTESGGNGAEPTHAVTILGRAAHSSLPHLGVNAAIDGLELALLLFGDAGPSLKAARRLRRAAAASDGSGLGCAMSHPFVGDTTAALTILDLSPTKLSANINVRFTMGLTIAETMKRAEAALKGDPIIVAKPKIGAREPIYVDADKFGSYMKALTNSYEQIQGRPATPFAIGGTTFAKAFTRAVCFGPVDPADGEPELAHQVDERIKVDHNLRNLKIYTLALARLASANPDL